MPHTMEPSWNKTQLRDITLSGALSTWVGKLETSLEIDSNDHPHIAYYDDKNDTLGYSYYDGAAWIDTTVTTDDGNDRGRHGSIGLDSNDYPRIAYYNVTGTNLGISNMGWFKLDL